MKILILDAHGDDWLWAGGTINKCIESGDTVMYMGFSQCGASLQGDFTVEDYLKETIDSLKMIGITIIQIFDYPVRRFNEYRQAILDKLIQCRNTYKPDVVYTPSTYDVHQDHAVISRESIRAFSKTSSIFGYDMPWNVLNSMINRYVELTHDNLLKKINCAFFYKSQIDKDNNCLTPYFLESLAIVRGNKINVKYAESFEVIVLRD